MQQQRLATEGLARATAGQAAAWTEARPEDRLRLVRLGGILHGALFALFFAAACWGYDALELHSAGAFMPWSKLLTGTPLVLLIGILTGWLATCVDRVLLRAALWSAAGVAIATVAAHVLYEGQSWLVALSDPYPAAHAAYPFPGMVGAGKTGLTMLVGGFLGIFVGMLHGGAAERAWEEARPREGGYSFNFASLFSIALRCLPLAVVFALVADDLNNATWRATVLDMAYSFELARDPSQDLVKVNLASLRPYRAALGSSATLYIVRFEPTPDQSTSTVDAVFDNGLMLRCLYIGQVETQASTWSIPLCSDMGREGRESIAELASLGHLTCSGCNVQVDYGVRRWFATAAPALGALQDVRLLQHQGAWLYERATFAGGRTVDCRLRGASPAVVDLCIPTP